MFVISNARDNGNSKGRLKNRIVMAVCEFCYSSITLYIKNMLVMWNCLKEIHVI